MHNIGEEKTTPQRVRFFFVLVFSSEWRPTKKSGGHIIHSYVICYIQS